MKKKRSARKAPEPCNERFAVGLTLREHIEYVLPRANNGRRACPTWPADVFAVAASLLTRKGVYAAMLKKWPPKIGSQSWVEEVRNIGKGWRRSWPQVPASVISSWNRLFEKRKTELRDMCKDRQLVEDLVYLCACADEACSQTGLFATSDVPEEAAFYVRAFELIENGHHGSTLCEEIHPERVRVLPKMHTPQSGMTIRSLSLNLGVILADEIVPRWHYLPELEGAGFNILFVPWPLEVFEGDIKSCPANANELDNMPDGFGFFKFSPPADRASASEHLESLLASSEVRSNEIHAIVYPELAVTESEFESLKQIAQREDKLLICGVRVDDDSSDYPRNEVRVSAPDVETIIQHKHHRWKLDAGQIEQYHLERDLTPQKQWWEHIDISSREFMFYAVRDGLVFATLICEDLARPDPVGDLVRAVGPNLVIALLMDGPQLKARWSGRYAATLADDPGSTVLSLTSLGMSLRSLPKDPKDVGTANDRRRVVALWQSPNRLSCKEIELAVGAGGMLLPLVSKTRMEWAADGRDDNGKSAFLDLSEPIMVFPASK